MSSGADLVGGTGGASSSTSTPQPWPHVEGATGGGSPLPMPFHSPLASFPGPQATSPELARRRWRYPPINIIYLHFHDSIRAELSSLAELAKELEHASDAELGNVLQALKQRYKFMEQVYRYHSSVEDEVVYPALDAKVRNVTLAYTVEHESEEFLFDQLASLLSTGLSQPAEERPKTVRHLLEKVEEIHTTVKKHLAKEEEQLFPLLLQQFSHGEQAALVAEFFCSIPLAAVNKVLAWLKPNVPPEEQEELLEQVSLIIHDKLLGQLLAAWLRPTTSTAGKDGPPSPSAAAVETSGDRSAGEVPGPHPASPPACGSESLVNSQPVMLLRHIHSAISSALHEFTEEAVSLQANGTLQGSQLTTLLEQYRFLRAVCTFHSHSENETMLPIAQRVAEQQSAVAASCRSCEDDHILEAANFDALGRLLADVRSCTRRGGKEANLLAAELCRSAEAVKNTVNAHIQKEESEVLPVLADRCSLHEQRLLFWQTIRAMPLRLLERMLPWVASQVSDEQCSEMLHTMRMAGAAVGEPEISSVLVQLLVQWAQRGRATSNAACGRVQSDAAVAQGGQEDGRSPKRMRLSDLGLTLGVPSAAPGRPLAASARPPVPEAGPSLPSLSGNELVNPIDHIFQFHKALKREVKHLEKDAQSLSNEAEAGGAVDGLVHQLQARFHFLKGIYIAHSEAEDKIVFPALERKEVSRNVSHAYSLDHQKEQEMFNQVDELLSSLKANLSDAAAIVPIASRMRVTCAAVRANLDMHVRAEETELWPLFNEHFSFEEQESIVGSIIGNTGAEVLQTMITWVGKETEPEEQAAMMDALRSATRNTRFDKWLSSIIDRPSDAPDECASAGSDAEETDNELPARLKEVASFLVEASGTTAESAEFRPGWEDIFLINQQQLEGAVRRVSNDPNLDPHRKAYIIQSIMASKYIVAQQRKIRGVSRQNSCSVASTPTSASTPPLSFPVDPPPVSDPSQSSMEQVLPERICRGVAPETSNCGCSSGAAAPAIGRPPSALLAAAETPADSCKHYKRNCALVAPCCNTVVSCRLCHDETEDHKMDRYAVREMVCKMCNTQQAVAGSCVACGQVMARYYCSICHLFDDEPGRDIYHCPSCNVCRRGKGLGIDFFHCMKCNSCMSLSLFEKHTCRERSLEGNCAVCHEYLFDSPTPIKELPCGHFMHSSCFGAYTRYNYTCPICSKSMGDMRVYFQMLDALVASERLPDEYRCRTQHILCNDCCRQGSAPYHFVYHACQHCGSYNTRIM